MDFIYFLLLDLTIRSIMLLSLYDSNQITSFDIDERTVYFISTHHLINQITELESLTFYTFIHEFISNYRIRK